MPLHLITIAVAFIALWFGAGLAIASLEHLAKRLKTSSFSLSFVIMGFLTSISEISVGINSLIDKHPEIFVGNLIGASLVIVLLIIPLLAVLNKGIKINLEASEQNFKLSLFTIALPVFFILDGSIALYEALIMIFSFLVLTLLVQRKKNIFLTFEEAILHKRDISITKDLLKVLFGSLIVFVSSKLIVDNIIYLSSTLDVSTFVISVLLLSIGTNLPELSILIKSLFKRKSHIALGTYIGSASFNTLLMGSLTVLNQKPVILSTQLDLSLLLLPLGCFLFYSLSRKHILKPHGALLLLSVYIFFVLLKVA